MAPKPLKNLWQPSLCRMLFPDRFLPQFRPRAAGAPCTPNLEPFGAHCGTILGPIFERFKGQVWNISLNQPPRHSCYNCVPASLGRRVSALALTIFHKPKHWRQSFTSLFEESPLTLHNSASRRTMSESRIQAGSKHSKWPAACFRIT